jgi:hypothetical protein
VATCRVIVLKRFADSMADTIYCQTTASVISGGLAGPE